jgi:FkbM family methyltransferase
VIEVKTNVGADVGRSTIEFFAQNQDRVKKVVSLFSDEESKRTYLKVIKYRQTYHPKDYPRGNKEEGGYFRYSFFTFSNNEVLIDCGAYTGDTIEEFLSMNVGYEKIIAFEPESKSFQMLKKKYNKNSKIMLINAGTYSKDGELYFSGSNSWGKVSETSKSADNEVSIKVRSIDGLHLQEKVTFIKMDIEGSEFKALMGAKETILRDKPKLAVCLYHLNEDMVRIAEYIHELVPEYKLYVRHNSSYPLLIDTILYATI